MSHFLASGQALRSDVNLHAPGSVAVVARLSRPMDAKMRADHLIVI